MHGGSPWHATCARPPLSHSSLYKNTQRCARAVLTCEVEVPATGWSVSPAECHLRRASPRSDASVASRFSSEMGRITLHRSRRMRAPRSLRLHPCPQRTRSSSLKRSWHNADVGDLAAVLLSAAVREPDWSKRANLDVDRIASEVDCAAVWTADQWKGRSGTRNVIVHCLPRFIVGLVS
jgi:hypothetical protein